MLRALIVVAVLWNGASAVWAVDPPKDAAAKDNAAANEATSKPKAAQASAKITVRDVNLYVMSAYGNSLNNAALFKSTMPGFMGMRRVMAERKNLNHPSPAGLITFEGEPNDDVDVLLEFKNGKFFGNWPPCPQKSKRLLWVKAKLTKEKGDAPLLPENHWMTFLRESDRLWFEAGRRSERFILYDAELPLANPLKVTLAEGGHGLANTGKFKLHDVTVYKPEGDQWVVGSVPLLEPPPKKEEKTPAKDDKAKKKPDPEALFDDKDKEAKDKAAKEKPADGKAEGKTADEKKADQKKADDKNTEEKKADDKKSEETKAAPAAAAPAVVAAPGAQPTPAAGPTDPAKKGEEKKPEEKKDDTKVVNVPSTKEPQGKDAVAAAWVTRLKELGLGQIEADYLSKQLAEQALRKDSATIVFRLDDDQLEEMFPLEVTPAPQKQIRVALVVLLDSDPDVAKRVEELVKKLGDSSYAEREAAMAALKKLGPAAKQKVQEAVNDKDAEIAYRAEQLVELINNPNAQAGQPNP